MPSTNSLRKDWFAASVVKYVSDSEVILALPCLSMTTLEPEYDSIRKQLKDKRHCSRVCVENSFYKSFICMY